MRVSARNRGNTWFLDWYADGRRHRRSLGPISKEEAEAEATRLAAALLDSGGHAGLVPTLGEYYRQTYAPWSQLHTAASWDRKSSIFEQHLLPEFAADPLNTIKVARVEKWMEKRLIVGAAAATVQRELNALRALLRHAVDREVLSRVPCRGAKVPMPPADPPPHWYTAAHLEAIYQAEHSEIWRAVWRLVANTGMRRGEAQALLWENIREDSMQILSLDRQHRTKSGKSRTVPLSPGAKEALETLHSLDGPRVVPKITPQSLSRRFTKVLARAGLDGSFHSLRHTFVTHLLNAGAPLHLVKELAGHASITTTQRYAHAAQEDALRAVSGLSL